MHQWLLTLLGKSADAIPEGARTELIFSHAPSSWQVYVFILVVVAMLYAVVWFYRREKALTRIRRWSMTGIRIVILALLLLIVMGPNLGVSLQKTIEPVVLVLLDESLSISIRDKYRDEESRNRVKAVMGMTDDALKKSPPSRADVMEHLLTANDGKLIKDLSGKGRVQLLSFSDEVVVREAFGLTSMADEALSPTAEALPKGEPVPPIVPKGPLTNYGRALRESLASVSGSPVSGVIMLTDGRDTVVEEPHRVAAMFADHKIPIFPVGLGDPSAPFNLAVQEAWAPDNAFIDDPFIVQAKLSTRSPEPLEVTAELVMQKVGETEGTVVATKKIRLDPEAPAETVEFEHKTNIPGKYTCQVRIPVRSDEIIANDNVKSMQVHVLDRKAKVLLISGGPTWDYRFVRNLLMRDKTIDVSCWLQSMDKGIAQDGNTALTDFPKTSDNLFAFDAIIMMDVNPDTISSEWVQLLTEFLGVHAGGLLWMSGPKYSSHFLNLPRTRPVRDLLPVTMSDSETLVHFGQKGWLREWPLAPETAGLDHPIMRMLPDVEKTRQYWQTLPGVYWSFPSHNPKPGATVLLSHSDPSLATRQEGHVIGRPLLVLGQYGLGKSLYFGFDSTWRWRRGGETHFDRFWVQAVRTVAEGRRLKGKRRGTLVTDQSAYGLGDRVLLSARLFDQEYKPLQEEQVEAEVGVDGEDTTPVTLEAVSGKPGHYQATIVAKQLGDNDVIIRLDGQGGENIIEHRFGVAMPKIEFAQPSLHRNLLKQIATQSGGAYFDIDQMDDLVKRIPEKRETVIVRGKPITLWDSQPLMWFLIGLLCVEWILRKRYKLL